MEACFVQLLYDIGHLGRWGLLQRAGTDLFTAHASAAHSINVSNMPRSARQVWAANAAGNLFTSHGLADTWHFDFDRAMMRAGCCFFNKQLITLSTHYVDCPTVPDNAIIDTILHEIAHALAGPYARHGAVWKEVAMSIGCSASVCSVHDFRPPFKWRVLCPCGHVNCGRYRKPSKNMVCKKCASPCTFEQLHRET